MGKGTGVRGKERGRGRGAGGGKGGGAGEGKGGEGGREMGEGIHVTCHTHIPTGRHIAERRTMSRIVCEREAT